MSNQIHRTYRSVDVAIIGASLAGAATALHLQKAGLSLLIVDKDDFPRRKACGEGLSSLGIDELNQIGIKLPLEQFPHIPFYGFTFVEQSKQSSIQILPESSDRSHGIGIQRAILDHALIETLQLRGNTEIILNENPIISRLSDNTFSIHTREGNFNARYLVLATGGLSRTPQRLGVPLLENNSSRCGVRVDLKVQPKRDPMNSMVTIFTDNHVQVCCTPVSSDQITLTCMTHKKHAALLRGSQLKALIERVSTATGLNGDITAQPLGAAQIGRFSRPLFFQNIYMVGDAYKQLDPIGGMGMTQALVSARITSETIRRIIMGNAQDIHSAQSTHTERTEEALKMLTAYTQLSYWSLVSTVGKNILGKLKNGTIARQVLLGMHQQPEWKSPSSILASLLLTTVGNL